MTRYIPLLLFICFIFQLKAQAQTGSITGTVFEDATKESIELASIRVLNAKDSTYVTGTATDKDGKFSVGVKPNRYIVQISFLGYIDQYVDVNVNGNTPVGSIYLKENSVLLNEAVVTAKAVEVQVKGDTIEYNADSYKVQESAVIEDLLKKMPGVEIDVNGKITVNGKEVKKFLVDGKEFFSDDPKVASKNLPASMVNKLQVLDRKSDMSQMTGFDDGNEETVINLTIKPGMKQGVFGNGYGGYGSDDRYEGNAMVNYMRNSTQISVLAGSNNTNNAGFSDFASSMFGGNRPPRGINFGGNNGISKSTNGGFNFATEYSDKFKWGGDIRYGSVDNDVISNSERRYTDSDSIGNESRLTKAYGNNLSNNFGANFRFEWKADSSTMIIFRPTFQYNKNVYSQESDARSVFNSDSIKNYNTVSSDYSDGNGITLNGNLDISRKLSDKGRVLSFSISGGINESDRNGLTYMNIDYFDPLKSDSILNQKFFQDDRSYNWRIFTSYVEPLGRNNFLQLTYNIRNNNSNTDRRTYDWDNITNDFTSVANDYTRNVKNDFINQNVSLNFKSVRDKYNYTVGLGLEPSSSRTKIIKPDEGYLSEPRRHFLSFAPNAQFNYLWDKRHNLRIDYSGVTTQPTTLQLFNGITNIEGLNNTSGNPNLAPSFQNRLNVRYQKFNQERASMLMIRGRFTHTLDDIVTVARQNTAQGRDFTYENINGNMTANARVIFNTPLRNKKFSLNSMSYASYVRDNTYLTSLGSNIDSRNTANIYSLQQNMGIQFRSDVIDFGLRGNIAYNNTVNSISKTNDEQVFNYGGYSNFTLYLPYDFILDSDVQYSANSGNRLAFQLNEWIWNASLAKQVFKAKNGTIRLKIYDILHQRTNISQRNNSLYIEDITTNALNSYFMVHFVYKFQIFKGGAKRSDMEDNMRRGGGRGGFDGPPPGGGDRF